MTASFRCSAASGSRDDPLAGTASTVGSYLLLEHAGPWGPEALRDSRLPAALGPALRRHAAASGCRPLLIRRSGRQPHPAGGRVFVVSARMDDPWIETTLVPDLEAVLDLDLSALAGGRSVGLERHSEPLFCVCTHGRHDPCCAERGRPVAVGLTASDPQRTWECTHIGGDRFAGNMLVLPQGLYYGRVDAESARRVASAHLAGNLDLDHLRGRSSLPMPVQAAEIELRRSLAESRLDAVRFLGRAGTAGRTVARFLVGGAHYAVTIRTDVSVERHPLTCRSTVDSALPRHEVVLVERVSG